MAQDLSDRPTQTRRGPLVIPLLVVALVILAALVWLAVQRFLGVELLAPTPTSTATAQPAPSATPPQVAAASPTPTRVLVDAEATATPLPSPAAATPTPAIAEVSALMITRGERLRNGSFENGFKDNSVGLGWVAFQNGSAIYEFMDETWSPAVFDGQHAQRIQVREASQPDRYAGIYQTVSVIPGETYHLTLHGQTRTGEGDIKTSQYGYRVQLGIDYQGGQDWADVEEWIELPWDEQRFDSSLLFFYDYERPVVAAGSRLTLFIRTWNKWPDPGRVEYTLDALSLIGPGPSEEIAFDRPLPLTGEAPLSVGDRVRLLASAAVLGLLVAGAVWQVRRQSR